MDILNYVKSLVPSFEKDQVLEDIRATREELKKFTMPAYKGGAEALKGWKFKSEVLKPQLDQFKRMVKFGNGSIVDIIEDGLAVALVNLDAVEDLIERSFSTEVTSTGMTFMRTQALQFVECVAFVSKFSRKYLNYIYICELAEYEDGGSRIADSLAPAEIEWLNANFVSFCSTFNCVVGRPGEIRKALDSVPDVVISDDNVPTMTQTVGITKLDPLMMRFIPIILNPAYHIGMRIAEWQARRYKAAQEELAMLQLRRMNLERVAQGKPDARLQKELKILESRCQDLNYEIAEMEKKYA